MEFGGYYSYLNNMVEMRGNSCEECGSDWYSDDDSVLNGDEWEVRSDVLSEEAWEESWAKEANPFPPYWEDSDGNRHYESYDSESDEESHNFIDVDSKHYMVAKDPRIALSGGAPPLEGVAQNIPAREVHAPPPAAAPATIPANVETRSECPPKAAKRVTWADPLISTQESERQSKAYLPVYGGSVYFTRLLPARRRKAPMKTPELIHSLRKSKEDERRLRNLPMRRTEAISVCQAQRVGYEWPPRVRRDWWKPATTEREFQRMLDMRKEKWKKPWRNPVAKKKRIGHLGFLVSYLGSERVFTRTASVQPRIEVAEEVPQAPPYFAEVEDGTKEKREFIRSPIWGPSEDEDEKKAANLPVVDIRRLRKKRSANVVKPPSEMALQEAAKGRRRRKEGQKHWRRRGKRRTPRKERKRTLVKAEAGGSARERGEKCPAYLHSMKGGRRDAWRSAARLWRRQAREPKKGTHQLGFRRLFLPADSGNGAARQKVQRVHDCARDRSPMEAAIGEGCKAVLQQWRVQTMKTVNRGERKVNRREKQTDAEREEKWNKLILVRHADRGGSKNCKSDKRHPTMGILGSLLRQMRVRMGKRKVLKVRTVAALEGFDDKGIFSQWDELAMIMWCTRGKKKMTWQISTWQIR